MGMLNGETTAGAAGATVVTIDLDVDATCVVAITENADRGGIIATDGTPLDIASQTGDLINGPSGCVNTSASFYTDWTTFGSPDCWCYARNCLGDVDGLSQGSALAGYAYVSTDDLTIFLNAYGVKEPPKGDGIATITNGICADFARNAQGSALAGYARVSTDDLTILLANYNIKEPPKGDGIGDCTGPDYNYFITP
jgi:hypothetical protein